MERTLNTQQSQAVERLGLWWQSQGLPRIAGRILGYLVLQPAAVTLDDIAEALKVSKASVSTDARRLEQLSLVTRVSKPGDRRDYYVVAPDMPRRVVAQKIDDLELLDSTLRGAARVEDTPPTVRSRLESFSRFHQQVLTQLHALLAELPREDQQPSNSSPAT